MKRFIAVLLVMGVIMTAFAEEVVIHRIELTGDNQNAASTTVTLTLDGNYGKVWFSKGEGNGPISNYNLVMVAPNELVTSLLGNEGTASSPKVYAKSAEGTSDGLYLNWNIVSTVPVCVSLNISTPLTKTHGVDETVTTKDKIGWAVTSNGKTLSVSDTGTVTNGTAIVDTKNATTYGKTGSQLVEIETDNVWSKNNGTYTATLTALIKTKS